MTARDREKKPAKSAGALSLVDAAAAQTAYDLVARGRAGEALGMLEDLARRNPKNAPLLFNLGTLQYRMKRLDDAEKSFRLAAARAPGDGQALASLACVKLDQGALAEGRELWDRARQQTLPAGSWVTAGAIFRELGDLARARECFETAVRLDPGSVEGYYGISATRKFTADEFAALRRLPPPKGAEEKIQLAFSLGKGFLDHGDADEAFRHYGEGNRLKRSQRPVDMSLYEKYADSLIDLFDEKLVRKLSGAGSVTSRQPIFIVGMMRSGSTLTDQILSSHPDVASIGESEFLVKTIPVYPNAEVPGHFRAGVASITRAFVDALTPDVLDGIGRKYLELTAPSARGASRVVDKMLHNFFWVGLIRLALPNAKIIYTTRDPVDTGLSLYTLLFTTHLPWTYDQRDIGRYILTCRKIMAHWQKLFPRDIFEANYETMVADQEGQTRRLLEFCGLPWDDACLKFHENKRHVNTASATQVRQPMYKDSVKKWKKYEAHLKDLIDTLEGGA